METDTQTDPRFELLPRPDRIQVADDKFGVLQRLLLTKIYDEGIIAVTDLYAIAEAELGLNDKYVSSLLSWHPGVRAWRERKWQGKVFYAPADVELSAEDWKALDMTKIGRRQIEERESVAVRIKPGERPVGVVSIKPGVLGEVMAEAIAKAQEVVTEMQRLENEIRIEFSSRLAGVVEERREAERILKALGVTPRRVKKSAGGGHQRASRERMLAIVSWAAANEPEKPFTIKEVQAALDLPYQATAGALSEARDAHLVRRWGTAASNEALFMIEDEALEQFRRGAEETSETGGSE